MKSPSTIMLGIDIITKGQVLGTGKLNNDICGIVDQTILRQKGRTSGLLSSTEFLLEQLSYQGITIPNNFLMFEKSLITLKGIMAHIDPSFKRDDYLIWEALIGYYQDLSRPRFYAAFLKELWLFYRSSLGMWFKLQKTLFKIRRAAFQG